MNPDYALEVLKGRKYNLVNCDLGKVAIKYDEKNVEKLKTRIKHQIASLDFAIEILEEYQD